MNRNTSRNVTVRARRRRRIFALVHRPERRDDRARLLPGPPRCLRERLDSSEEASR